LATYSITRVLRHQIVDDGNKKNKNNIVILTLDDVINNIDVKLVNKRRLINAMALMNSEKKLNNKIYRIHEGIMRFNPFMEFNDLYALLIADAFMRLNKFQLYCAEDTSWFADSYCWFVKFARDNKVIKSNFLDKVFVFKNNIKEENTKEIWGFKNDYPIIVNAIKENLMKGTLSYERESEETQETQD
jgi:hypothetical protein